MEQQKVHSQVVKSHASVDTKPVENVATTQISSAVSEKSPAPGEGTATSVDTRAENQVCT